MKQKPGDALGAVFTPLKWGAWAAEHFGITDAWLGGKTVLDPTCGEGHLLEALIRSALGKGVSPENLPLNRLHGIEREKKFLEQFRLRLKQELGIDFPENNLHCADFLQKQTGLSCDIIFGNPPWCNFTDLAADEKQILKPLFHQYKLVQRSSDMLLGHSRIDIAALVIVRAVRDSLEENGKAFFFAPLSLVLGDGAHSGFRNFNAGDVPFSINSVHDFGEEKVFEGVHTRHGLLSLVRNSRQEFPVPYSILRDGAWQPQFAQPRVSSNDAWSITEQENKFISALPVRRESMLKPRQGINTGGANDVFLFHTPEEKENGNVEATNGHGERFLLPAQFLYPLLGAENFREQDSPAKRFVLLPYHTGGTILTENDLNKHPLLANYLFHYKNRLEARKGTLLRSKMRKGCWWALFGVGSYNFAPYKVVWEAYGKNTFEPILAEGRWQANQSLQAYVPFSNRRKAQQFLRRLKAQPVERLLRSQMMKGTMNWAQPGKMEKLFQFLDL
ncbi:MAG: hypothetical protein FD123_2684 [Bacteroidetes bacterium]|nr:MAG: hypothetical protein FD123_2684 [Bacteroidota bacterium]